VESTPRDPLKSIGLHLLFLGSGLSGLIYQVVWVRQFGQVFGNTVYSASIVVAIFMLGLGAGSLFFGAWADRRSAAPAGRLVWAYAGLEAIIAALGLLIAFVLPHLSAAVAAVSAYEVDAHGWYTLTIGSYVWRGLIALVLVGPIAWLMGGTLTVLIRALVHADRRVSGWNVGLLYGANTLGAAAGAFLTDFALVPAIGMLATQFVAVGLNVVAAAGAYLIGKRMGDRPGADLARSEMGPGGRYLPVALALACMGFAALGMEILWLRHLNVLLGGFRAVFALLLSVMLLALGAGALAGGWLDRRFGRPALMLMYVEALFAVTTLLGLAAGDADTLAAHGAAIANTLRGLSSSSRTLAELWFNLRPMMLEVALPSLIGGLAFPLANAIVQRVEASVGRRAGVLYAANTVGAVCGSLAAGYLLLPHLGMQASAAVLAGVAVCAIVPLAAVTVDAVAPRALAPAAAVLIGVVALVVWLRLPSDFIVTRALGQSGASGRVLTMNEGVTELRSPDAGAGCSPTGMRCRPRPCSISVICARSRTSPCWR
jgi:spermidine synthase